MSAHHLALETDMGSVKVLFVAAGGPLVRDSELVDQIC
jgi:hypothetical protein